MTSTHAATGITGLDAILFGGWPSGRMYLVEGYPGTGKTTLGFQFLLAGVALGEPVLYITLSETRDEVLSVATAHGWNLDAVSIFELDAAESVLGLGDEQTMFDPSDVEFRATSRAVLAEIERVRPSRIVFDSLSELALLSRDPLSFRRELLMLKRAIMDRGATTLLMSDRTDPDADRHLHSLAHGVLALEETSPDYGPSRRRLRVRKLRASDYRAGYHDFSITRGGLVVYPRLVTAGRGVEFSKTPITSGIEPLDRMLGGGLARGGSTLFLGPAGSGKSSLVSLFAHASVEGGERATVFLFDEELDTFLDRSEALGHPLRGHVEAGMLEVQQIDPGQLSPGEFVHRVCVAVEERDSRFIAIDSLNGYIYAMPEERYLALQIHEMLSLLARLGVATALVLTQSGLVGPMSSPADLTYIADAVVLTRFFEAGGEVRRAVSMLKKRSGPHGAAIHELSFTPEVTVGEALRDFEGILTGVPTFVGDRSSLRRGSDT